MLELSGQTVLTTRSREQAAELNALLEKRGATVLSQPAIEILPPDDFGDVDDALQTIRRGEFAWILFSSSNGVRFLWNRFDSLLGDAPQDVFFNEPQERAVDAARRAFARSRDVAEWNAETFEEKIAAQNPFLTPREESALGALRRAAGDETRRASLKRGAKFGRNFNVPGTSVAAVGPGTADAARELGVRIDLIPDEEFNAEGLVAALAKTKPSLDGTRILSVRANRGRDVLTKELEKLGADVRELVAYRSVDVETPRPEIVAALEAGKIDRATVASSATAKALVRMFGPATTRTRWVALSPSVAKTLESLGAPVVGVAQEATLESLVEAVVASEGVDPFDGVRATPGPRRPNDANSPLSSVVCGRRSKCN